MIVPHIWKFSAKFGTKLIALPSNKSKWSHWTPKPFRMHKFFNKKTESPAKKETTRKKDDAVVLKDTATKKENPPKKVVATTGSATPKNENGTKQKDPHATDSIYANLQTEEYWTWLCCNVSTRTPQNA